MPMMPALLTDTEGHTRSSIPFVAPASNLSMMANGRKIAETPVPKATQDAVAIATATIPAVKNTVHCDAAISTKGNSNPYCGL